MTAPKKTSDSVCCLVVYLERGSWEAQSRFSKVTGVNNMILDTSDLILKTRKGADLYFFIVRLMY